MVFRNPLLKVFIRRGKVVIIVRGSQYILQDEKDAVHALLVLDLYDRVKFLIEKYDISDVNDARKTVFRADKLRENFLFFLLKIQIMTIHSLTT